MFRSPFYPRPAPEPPHLGRRTGCSIPWTWTFFRLKHNEKERKLKERNKREEKYKKVEINRDLCIPINGTYNLWFQYHAFSRTFS
jgi:hypothetical protein